LTAWYIYIFYFSPGGKLSITASIEGSQYNLLCKLFDKGASPEYLSLQEGDTPIHAALSIALDKDKGTLNIYYVYMFDTKMEYIVRTRNVSLSGSTLVVI